MDRLIVFKLQDEFSELGSVEEALQQGVEIAGGTLILEADEASVVPMAPDLQPICRRLRCVQKSCRMRHTRS